MEYIPTGDGVRFLTWYDYRTRFGILGRAIDGFLFRRLIGWATAWSFDRLRLQMENRLDPKAALRFAAIHACSRVAITFIWLYQGLVPKLLFGSPDEHAILAASHLPPKLLLTIGLVEIAISVYAVLSWGSRWFFLFNIGAMVLALLNVALVSPSYLAAAFNPVTLNFGMIALSVVGYLAAAEIPSASRCLRAPLKDSG